MSGTTQRARQVWLVDTANETIETTADAMTKPMKCILILTLFGTIIKALVSTVLDITSDVTVAINYISIESPYPNQSMAQLFPEHSQSGRWDVILDQVRSFKHWFGMTSQELCLYTIGPFLLAMFLILIETIEIVTAAAQWMPLGGCEALSNKSEAVSGKICAYPPVGM